jgi:hypothetical protein
MQSVAHFGQQRSNGEPNEKGNKERPPRIVKGAHVRALEGTNFQLRRLEPLIGIDRQVELFSHCLVILVVSWPVGHSLLNGIRRLVVALVSWFTL